MTDSAETRDSVLLQLNEPGTSDDEAEGWLQSFPCDEEVSPIDIPPSLLSYFETSKTRAGVCEKLILEEPEDFTVSNYTKDMRSLPSDRSKDVDHLSEQVICETEHEENKTDSHSLQEPTETQTPFTHDVTVRPNNDDAGIDQNMENENYLALKISKYEVEQEKCRYQEMQKNEERRQREMDFQEALKKIMEAEKLHQTELELMAKRAQKKFEQELQLQRELIGNLQKQVEQERRRIEEEQKRKKEAEERKIKETEEKRKKEEEYRRKRKEEEDKMKVEMEEKRKRLEENDILEEEEKKNTIKLKLREEEERRKKQEEQQKKEEEIKRITEEEKNRREEEIRKKKEVKIKEIQLKSEDMRREEEEVEIKKQQKEKEKQRNKNRKTEDEETRIKEDEKFSLVLAGKMMTESESESEYFINPQREITEDEKGKYEEMVDIKEDKTRNEREEEEKQRKEVVGIAEEHEVRLKQEQKGRKEEESEKAEVKRKMMDEQVEIKDDKTRKIENKAPLKGGEEKRREHEVNVEIETMEKEEKTKTKEEEQIKRRIEEIETQTEEEEIKTKPQMWGITVHEADNRKTESESKTKDKEERKDEVKKHQERNGIVTEQDGMRTKDDAMHYGEEVKEKMQTEEQRVTEEEKSMKNTLDAKKDEGVTSKNELQEKEREHFCMKSQNDNAGSPEHALTSQPGGSTKWTPTSPHTLLGDSTSSPTCAESANQQDKTISQTSLYKTADQREHANPSTCSCSWPACLPEHAEQKRLSWMKDCIPWSKLSLQNKRKQKGCVQSRRGPRRPAEGRGLPALCPHTLLQSTGWKSLQEVTTVTLEDLPACSLSTLAECTQLQSLTLRRCGLKSLEGINHLQELWYIDLQENYISFVDCENMSNLRVLRLAHNKLTSIHGLNGAENLDVLDLSHNSITRIAGLEPVRRLQRLSLDHNQLISTKGLRDVYTLLHLDCSHNHLANVEGLENSALLHTLDLRGNSLTEPPSLNNQVLLRELQLDDNSISSLQGLAACWLPLMQHLSAAQNRITQLPSMSDFVSLKNLDLRYNCLSELQNVCENLEGCQLLREVHLTGNPLQQERGWRSTLQKAVPGLRAIDSLETDSFFLPPAVQQVSSAPGCFLTFCQAQLQQAHDLQQRHSRELSKASSPFDDVQSFCRHFTMTLKLAEDQRFAHEHGYTTVSDECWAAGQTVSEKTKDTVMAEKPTDYPEIESTNKVPPVILNRDNMRCSYWNFEEIPATETHQDTLGPKECPTTSFNVEKASVTSHRDLNLKNTAAVVIQQCWRKYKQKCGNINVPPITRKRGERGRDGGKPESRPSYINRSAIGNDYAATVIQALWRGFTLRRRLASALAAVTCPSSGEDDTLEEVDIDEFVLDEAALEEFCTFTLSQDSPPRHYPMSEQPLPLKSPGPCFDPTQDILPPPLERSPKQAWAAGECMDSAAQRSSPESSNRNISPASTPVHSGLSERSEKILEEWGFSDSRTAQLILKRAQKMKPKKQPQKKHGDPSVQPALYRNWSYQMGPVEARNRTTQHKRNYLKVGGHQQAEKMEQVKQAQTQQGPHNQATQSHRHSESDRFLPEINSSILSGGRVQLVADPAYADCLHQASRLWANSSSAAQPCKVNSYPRRNFFSHTSEEVASPLQVASAPPKRERLSFRDNPVQLSGGWGGGKKKTRMHK